MSINVAENSGEVPVELTIHLRSGESECFRYASNRMFGDGVFQFTTPYSAYVFPIDTIARVVSSREEDEE